ncbi:hypothetical protein Taro_006036, partial [Colocasia esculenta]|nr:hypothetical protein [Colocasia esculenta]
LERSEAPVPWPAEEQEDENPHLCPSEEKETRPLSRSRRRLSLCRVQKKRKATPHLSLCQSALHVYIYEAITLVVITVQILFAKMVSTHPTMVDTTTRAGRHWINSQNSMFAEWDGRSTQDESRSTLDPFPRTACFQIWDSVSKPPPGQVDTLRKDSNLRWMIATCHPRAMARSTPSYPVSTHTLGQVDTIVFQCRHCTPCQTFLNRGFRISPCCSCGLLHHCKPFLGIRSTRRSLSSHFRQEIPQISLSITSLSQSSFFSFINSRFHSILATMVRKMGPRHGARSQASSRPVPTDDDVPQFERRTKRRNDPAEQPGSSSTSQPAAKRGRPSSSGRGRVSRPENPGSSSADSTKSSSSSSESSKSQEPISEAKLILKPRIVDLTDIQLANTFPEIQTYFSFQSWLLFISEFQIIYPRLVREFYKNLKCTDEGYQSKVKGIAIDMPTDKAASIFKVPDEWADYHNFEFDLREAYTIMTGLPADKSDPKQTFVTKFNTNSFPPVLRIIHHMLTTIITPQGGGRDRLTDIQRFILYCMVKDIKINLHVIMYQIISETTRKDLKRSLPYAAHLTSVFQHFGVPLDNEKSQSIPKSNIYSFKNIQKFMGFRLEGTQLRPLKLKRNSLKVKGTSPRVKRNCLKVKGTSLKLKRNILKVKGTSPKVKRNSLKLKGTSPKFQHFSPQPTFQASSGGPSVPPELFSFLNDKFETLNTSIQSKSQAFELRIQRLENSVSAKFIEQKAASDYAAQRFNRLIGTMADASVQLKEHQQKLETVLQGILANSQADVFNTKQTLHEITSTRLYKYFLQRWCRHTPQWCRHNTSDSKAKSRRNAKTVLTLVKKQVDTSCKFQELDYPGRRRMRAGRHWTSFPEQPVFRIGTAGRHHHQGSVSTPPPGQVDTLRKDSNLRWMIAMCHPRAMHKQRKQQPNSSTFLKATAPATLLKVKKPTSWYKPQCGSARHKPLARFYTVYSPTARQKSFLEKKEQS